MIRLLLVEDEALVRMVAREVLESEGFDVLEARDGDEAVQMLDTLDRVDILVTDVRMPGRHDGIAVAQHARERFPGVPVIVASGFAANIQERLTRFEPRAAFMTKPYRLQTLTDLARSMAGEG